VADTGDFVVTNLPRSVLLKTAAIGLAVCAFALAGCGRKGGLDPPPGAAIADQPVAGQPRAAPGADGKPAAPQGAKQRTPIDWLID
jgi:predicted small lipoprotein YifL